ncbi:dihydrolipoyl dehydrogenase [Microbacterium amylolyticum]|uniref:Dihydrolipoyl dehydrogenase n=1 Tax=Microbacterium amylolyticum TaxID=936337 RepID=A0ABS4ZDV6_9MICO|nr:dihydrolipoyl dehydrogenase [Microbacterium amylolyticum]MBP2435471.1 dihydrolipoamide dehydrogenase [Microbacterium amylolyticum]
MTDHTFDLVVLGGGSGGYAAALRASELGSSVALVERDLLGGTCLHRGCVPTKALLHTAEVADSVQHAAAVGVDATLSGIDAAAARAWREKLVSGKHRGLTSLVAARGITVFSGEGRVEQTEGGPAVRVGEDLLRGTDVVVATGATSRPLPDVLFGGRVLDSERALALEEIPSRVTIIGGGVIGVEFASAWRSLGAEVTILEMADSLIPNEDEALIRALTTAYRRRGITVETGVTITQVAPSESGVDVAVTRAGGEQTTISSDWLLVAIGRTPATDDLGLDDIGVTRSRAFIDVDAQLRTTSPHVWAVGDIVPGPQLAHRGFRHGLFVAETIAGRRTAPLDDTAIPRVTYSSPEIASVGLTERQAAERHGSERIETTTYNLAGNAKAEIVSAGSAVASGLAKVIRVIDGPIIGVHLAGERVGELITEGQLAVAWEAHPEDLAPLVHAHPSQSEALGEAFLTLAGSPLHSL